MKQATQLYGVWSADGGRHFEAAMKYRDLIKLLEADGLDWVSTRGSHRKYRHPTKAGTLIVPAHGTGRDVKVRLEKGILKQAGLA